MGGDLSAGPTLSPKPADGDAAGGDSLPASFRRTALTSYLNTAASLVVALVTVPLLARVSGLNSTLARNIVDYRDSHGPFPNRQAIRKIPRLGDKTFAQQLGNRYISDYWDVHVGDGDGVN